MKQPDTQKLEDYWIDKKNNKTKTTEHSFSVWLVGKLSFKIEVRFLAQQNSESLQEAPQKLSLSNIRY